MRLFVIASVMLLCVPAASHAQPTPPAEPREQASEPFATRVPNPTRAACRRGGLEKSLRGPDLSDHIQICMLEARLACLKQAVSQKVRGRERRDFIRQCLAR